ncbi:unnamed protein product [Brassicogethes aeneus]|uniref:Endonuclease-reverse transcriptase n=1 Tax=Brassicogethes aeneus TaxID=1431903 RepID=A0A9P0BA86_BRAAE|nr:unnamed protein product [Brassicogethes aeneus]
MALTRSQQEKAELKQTIKDSIIEIFSDKDFIASMFKTMYDKFNLHEQKTEASIKKFEQQIDTLEQKIDYMYQAEKVNNICIHGIPDEKNENISNKAADLLKCAVPIISQQNLSAYRIGYHINNEKPRPVIVKFKIHQNKSEVMKNFKKIKNKKIYICEDLTKIRLDLLNEAKSLLGKTNVWTMDGNILTKIDDKIVKLKNQNTTTRISIRILHHKPLEL